MGANLNRPANIKTNAEFQILAYLVDHPKAQDTLEGIVEWWLLERIIKFQESQIVKALSELVDKGLIIAHKGKDAQMQYRINQDKVNEIQRLIKQRIG